MTIQMKVVTSMPEWASEPGLFTAFLEAEIRPLMNQFGNGVRERLVGQTLLFRGDTRRGWYRTDAKKFGTSFIITFINQVITANIQETGAPSRLGGSPGFSSPPPIQSAAAGSGRGLVDWVAQKAPGLISQIQAKIEANRGKGQGKLFGPNGDPRRSPADQAARRAAYAVARNIFKRGLPSPANESLLRGFDIIIENSTDELEELIAEAYSETRRKHGRSVVVGR